MRYFKIQCDTDNNQWRALDMDDTRVLGEWIGKGTPHNHLYGKMWHELYTIIWLDDEPKPEYGGKITSDDMFE